uniref:follistatin n=1 Tax=Myxine glutinosa TaxID=7769 RepID=UPI00358F1947
MMRRSHHHLARRAVPATALFWALLLAHALSSQQVQAGNCWLQQTKSGRCKDLLMTGVSQEECCRGGRVGSAFTHNEVSPATLFRWMAFSGGAPDCKACKETCENVDCGPGKQCRMSRRNKPRCVCAPECANTIRGPVCGTDGKTYRDECALLRARCRGMSGLEHQYSGKCQRSCKDVVCRGGTFCVLDQNSNAHCVLCNLRPCAEPLSVEQNICGKDGVTYASVCHLRRATCLHGRSIGMAYKGPCSHEWSKSCDDIICGVGKKCLWDSEMKTHRCSRCNDICRETALAEPVCGSDNVTYTNPCALRSSACSRGVYLEIKHGGDCSDMSKEELEEGAELEVNTFPKPQYTTGRLRT